MSAEGSRINPTDSTAMTALKDKQPGTVGELRAMLGLFSYYKQYRILMESPILCMTCSVDLQTLRPSETKVADKIKQQ